MILLAFAFKTQYSNSKYEICVHIELDIWWIYYYALVYYTIVFNMTYILI